MEKNKYMRFADLWLQVDAVSSKYFYPKVAEMGLSRGQPKMLRFLGENDGCRQKDIAERFYLRAASVSGILDTMEKNGLIVRKINPTSRRETLIYLTDLGKEKLEQVSAFYDNLDKEVFDGFGNDEFEILEEKLEKIMKAMELHTKENKE